MTARDVSGAESRILAVILANHNGIARAKIMAAADVSKSYFNVVAIRLMAEGKISRTGSGPSTVWGALGIEKRVPRKKRAESYRREQRRRAKARREAAKDGPAAEAWANSPPDRIIIPAHQAPPLRKPCPASIFEYGQMA